MKYFMGVDPGAKGSIAVLKKDGSIQEVFFLSSTEAEIAECIDAWNPYSGGNCTSQVNCCLERVHSMPGQGVRSMFTFGQNYGFLRGCLFSSGIVPEDVSPRTWQKELNIDPRRIKRGETKNKFKERLLNKAKTLWPHYYLWEEPKTKGKQLALCDALLIAESCRRKFQ
tara:strand:+ start:3909 stop:4415 length:507 start_codon:yes stop_codon:yes gene_type:complete